MSLLKAWILGARSLKTNWPDCCLEVLTAVIDAWLSVKIVIGFSTYGWSSAILKASFSPISFLEYTVKSVSGPKKAYSLSRVIAASSGIEVNSVTADASTLPSIPLLSLLIAKCPASARQLWVVMASSVVSAKFVFGALHQRATGNEVLFSSFKKYLL